MKKLFVSLVALMTATLSFAQNSLLATLSHEGNITTFYGANALRDAHEAAVHGDVISLSSGTFLSTNITKAVTIRGAGMEVNGQTGTEPTIISGYFEINIDAETAERLTIEGIYHNATISIIKVDNATFMKSRFYTIWRGTINPMSNGTFIHCRIANALYAIGSATFVNCIIWSSVVSYESVSNMEYINCVMTKGNGNWNNIASSSLRNCILISKRGYNLDESNTAYNCVSITDEVMRPTFEDIPNTTNTMLVSSNENIFKTYDGNYSDNETFELTAEASATYLGLDGTQVGIYGGTLPYNPTPSNPQITKCNVATKSTMDGKLSVDIEVSIAK